MAAIAAGVGLLFAPTWLLRLAPGLVIPGSVIEAVSLGLSVAVLGLVFAGLAGVRRFGRRRADDLLVLAASLSVAIWFDFGLPHETRFIHGWEQFHHFLGSRYYAELGYDGLYAASVGDQADQSPDGVVPPYIRDLRSDEIQPVTAILPHMREVYARFTPERWAAFSADNRVFLELNQGTVAATRKDRGYNASPTWTFVAQQLGRWQPASYDWLRWLAAVDLLLLAVSFGMLFRDFGVRTGCLAVVLFGSGYIASFEFVGGSLLRFDWLAAVGVALCMLRRGRPAMAGALLGYASAVRVFPALFLLGPIVLAGRALLRGERPVWLLAFAKGLGVSLFVCAVAGSLAGRGAAAWPEFGREIQRHASTWLSNNVGLENVVLYDTEIVRLELVDRSLPDPWLPVQQKLAERRIERGALLLALRGAFLLLFVAAVWRATLIESIAAGLVAIFALSSPSNYYWAMLFLVVLRPRTGIVTGVLALSLIVRAIALFHPAYEMRYGALSLGLALLFLAWLVPDALATLRRRTSGAAEMPDWLREPKPSARASRLLSDS